MSGTAEQPRTSDPRFPRPQSDALSDQSHLNDYLAQVASFVRQETAARLVGVYLLDKATDRLGLRAWADTRSSAAWSAAGVPAELGMRGIDGDDLSASTLRDYVHAAPKGQRIALPIHDAEHWVGSLVALFDDTQPETAQEAVHNAATDVVRELLVAKSLITDHEVAETEEDLELPSDAIMGTSAGGGVAVGPALLYRSAPVRNATTAKVEEDRDQALARLDAAIRATCDEIEHLLNDAGNELFDVVSLIFSAHLLMIKDEAFSGAIRSLVAAGQTPEDAVQSVVASFVRTFKGLREARLAEKAQDVRDIGQRVLEKLAADVAAEDEQVSAHIAIVQDVLPSDLVRLAMGKAAGVVLLGSTVTAHISILAQSLGLPVLFTADPRIVEIADQTPLLLDADEGSLTVSPTADQFRSHDIEDVGVRVAQTADSEPNQDAAEADAVQIFTNVNLLSDARRGFAAGAAGIGLYRSEFPFIIRNDYVSEEEQYQVYRTIISSMPGRPITLRTADIGGDKLLAGREEERNPFLGVRGIRFSLANRDLFRDQLSAMLRAGVGTDLRIMFPMVSSVEEIQDAKEEVDACIADLDRRGIPHHASPAIGAMIELPSAVVSIEDLAAECDFLSIGTNDLIMYLLAVDRTNERLSELYRSHHPVVLRTIADVAARIGPKIEELSVCGEAASDPIMIPFFLGIGIRKLSVSPRSIGRVRGVVSGSASMEPSDYAQKLLSIRTLREMERFLNECEKVQATA